VYISSKELLFITNEIVAVGQNLQVAVDWPMRLENRIPLILLISGHVLRSSYGELAMTIERHQFRIRKTESRV
jgi:hypothetical protein